MKILVVLPRFPYPLEKGDKLRAYNQVVELSKRHEIYLFCVSHHRVTEQQLEALRPYCKQVRVVRLNPIVCCWHVLAGWFTARSLQMGYWRTARARRAYRSFERKVEPDVVYNQMVRTMYLVAKSRYPKVMDFQDALSMNAERRMDCSRGFWRYIMHFEFKMVRSAEYRAFDLFDALTIISEADADAIPHKRNRDIAIVPNGVDFDYFSESGGEAAGTLGKYDIAFCGNMAYAPNINAVCYLVERVMPIVWAERPQTTLLIAGAAPTHKVQRLGEDKRVSVSGAVPDIRAAYASASVFAAPMQIGSGLQNKLLEAMAMGKPCVTTILANTALGAEDGRQLLVADTPQDFAGAILTLLDDRERASEMARQGYDFVHANYSWAAAVAKLETILNGIKLETR